MRERYRSFGRKVPMNTKRNREGTVLAVTENTPGFDQGYELIRDNNNGRSRPPSSCQHERIKWLKMPEYTVYSTWDETYVDGHHYGTSEKVNELLSYHYSPLRKGFRVQAQQVIDHTTRVADEVSLLNNLFEIDELPALFLKYKNLSEKFARLRGSAKPNKDSNFERLKAKDLPNYLDWEFGLAPLIADLRILHNNIKTVENRVLNLAMGNTHVLSLKDQSKVNGFLPQAYGYNRHQSIDGIFTGSLSGKVTAVIPGLFEAGFQLRVLADTIGLHLDAEVLWDAVPFTWLIDWFLPIGDQLKRYNDRKWVKVDLDGQAYITTKFVGSGSAFGSDYIGSPSSGDADRQNLFVKPGHCTVLKYDRVAINFGRSKRTKQLSLVVPDFDNRKANILAGLAQAKLASRR